MSGPGWTRILQASGNRRVARSARIAVTRRPRLHPVEVIVMALQQLEKYLQEHHVPYSTVAHRPAYTAQEIAAAAHVPGHELAKSVMVKLDDRLVMVVLSANERVNLALLRQATGAQDAALASEQEFRDRFPDCEVGAMPPFGNLFGFDVIVSESLTSDEEIAFNAGSHSELMRMRFEDYERLVHPRVARLTRH
jgi:Ala-tRNA(Pro) deacylase